MSGSGASNLGYGGMKPFSNVNGDFANKGSTNNPATFGSDVVPKGGYNGLSGIKNNVEAASGTVNSLSFFKGGGRRRKLLRQKIKNITRKYKGGSRKMKSRLRRRYGKRSMKMKMSRSRGRSRSFYGGAGGTSGAPVPYNDKALAFGYSLGGPMAVDGGANIALANPPLLHRYIGGKRRKSSRRTRRRSRRQRGGYGMMNGVPKLQFGPCNGCNDFYNHFTNSCGTLPK